MILISIFEIEYYFSINNDPIQKNILLYFKRIINN